MQSPAMNQENFHSHLSVLSVAQGYMELGMDEDAWMELEALDVDDLDSREERAVYLAMVLELAVRAGDWELGLQLADALFLVEPEMELTYIQAAYCLHELGRTGEARKKLRAAPRSLLKLATYHYNLACYEAVLGSSGEAMKCLRQALEIDPEMQAVAEQDADLRGLPIETIWKGKRR